MMKLGLLDSVPATREKPSCLGARETVVNVLATQLTALVKQSRGCWCWECSPSVVGNAASADSLACAQGPNGISAVPSVVDVELRFDDNDDMLLSCALEQVKACLWVWFAPYDQSSPDLDYESRLTECCLVAQMADA
jgi:hypothetical protein